jgi:hypothetical protein
MRATTCTNHCSGCGRHFHSLESFDLHRTGDYGEPLGSEGGRRCLSPLDVLGAGRAMRLEPLAEDGERRVGGENANGSPRAGVGVTIWARAGVAARREALSQLGGNALRAFGDRNGGETADKARQAFNR